jgi:hypothetical protein
VLEIDHVNGGGHAERRAGIKHGTRRYYDLIAANPSEYQLLCANCHKIKTLENSERIYGPRPAPQTPKERAANLARNLSSGPQRARALAREQTRRENATPATPEELQRRKARRAELERGRYARRRDARKQAS